MDVGTIIWNELMAASFWLQVDDRGTSEDQLKTFFEPQQIFREPVRPERNVTKHEMRGTGLLQLPQIR